MSINQFWGGRFALGPAAIMEKINVSIDFDKRLYTQDIAGSIAHCQMLIEQAILPKEDGAKIIAGLLQIKQEIAQGQFEFKPAFEDIHMNIEARLKEIIGDDAGRLHTARSRNDQVALDLRLWLREAIDGLDSQLQDLQHALIDKADAYADVLMPGFTHLQVAQPVTFGHHLLAYVEMIGRDRGRLLDCRKRFNECPLGAAALAGTSFPINRHMTAANLGFDHPTHNAMDSVASRDFVVEFLAAASLNAVHLSRLAEEIVIWASQQFAFISLSDAFTTGSSIMPQKKNPDAAELIRAKPGRIIGALNSLLIILKGLPMTYGKDLQEDKTPTFDAADNLALAIAAMAGLVRDMEPNSKQMRLALETGFPTATDLADWLVRALNMPFRQAHHVTGQIVALAEQSGVTLDALGLAEMQKIEPAITKDVYAVLSPENAVASRVSYGGTAPNNVRQQVALARQRFLSSRH